MTAVVPGLSGMAFEPQGFVQQLLVRSMGGWQPHLIDGDVIRLTDPCGPQLVEVYVDPDSHEWRVATHSTVADPPGQWDVQPLHDSRLDRAVARADSPAVVASAIGDTLSPW